MGKSAVLMRKSKRKNQLNSQLSTTLRLITRCLIPMVAAEEGEGGVRRGKVEVVPPRFQGQARTAPGSTRGPSRRTAAAWNQATCVRSTPKRSASFAPPLGAVVSAASDVHPHVVVSSSLLPAPPPPPPLLLLLLLLLLLFVNVTTRSMLAASQPFASAALLSTAQSKGGYGIRSCSSSCPRFRCRRRSKCARPACPGMRAPTKVEVVVVVSLPAPHANHRGSLSPVPRRTIRTWCRSRRSVSSAARSKQDVPFT